LSPLRIPPSARPTQVRRGVRPATAVAAAVAGLALVLPAQAGAVETAEPTPVPSATKPTDPPAGPKRNAKAKPRTVTLITGDRVTMVGDEQSSITAGPGRRGMTFLISTKDGHSSVIPMDAAYLVRAGLVDPRLFDVTALLAQGLDSKPTLPLIVTATSPAEQATAQRAVAAEGATAGRKLTAVNGIAVQTKPAKTTELWNGLTGRTTDGEATPTTLRAGVAKIWLDGVRQKSLDKSVPQIGAPAAWAVGSDGKGVTVAVLDGGIDAAHPDLVGQVTAARDFTDLGPGDVDGHGTHVASTIAGTGKASDGMFKGVAPGAKIADGKVCELVGCQESAILAGMHWAAAEIKAPVVNMSLGGTDIPGLDPLEAAVNTLSAEHGTLFVIAAGNSGPRASTVGSPGSADAALTVGAVDDTDELAEFSSRGPRVGDGAIKPDITAPGVDITAARASGSTIDDGASGPYLTISGTSMATPHVAGAAAILAQHRPGVTGAQLKELLMSSAKPHPSAGFDAQGNGRVDLAKAIVQTMTAAPGSLNLGTQVWPHTDDQPLAKDVTYRNTATTPVTLALAATVKTPDGTAGPADALKLSASSVTVPAGGTEVVKASMLLPATAALGRWSGQIVATAGDVQVRTPFVMVQEVEMAELTIKQLDERGRPVTDDNGGARVFGYDGVIRNIDVLPSASTVRVPVGSYFVSAWQQAAPGRASRMTLMSTPEVVLTKSATVTLDARQARKVDVRIPEQGAAQEFITATASVRAPKMRGTETVALFAGPLPVWLGSVGPAATSGTFTGKIIGHWAKPDADGEFGDSPYGYHGAWYQRGTFFTGFSKTLTKTEGATVQSTLARNLIEQGLMASIPEWPDNTFGATAVDDELLNLPTRRTERFFVNDDKVQWARDLWELPTDTSTWAAVLRAGPKSYQAGRQYQDSWNVPVHGPVVTPDVYGQFELLFYPGNILVAPSMIADAGGHFGWQYNGDGIRTKITRDGKVIADMEGREGYAEVPPETANYRVEQRLDRHSYAALSTRSEAAWTFRSAAVPPGDNKPVPLPLSVVLFRPVVDSTGHQKGGGVLRIPVTMQRLGAAGKALQIAVQVSYDDGGTWSTPQKLAPKDGENAVAQFTGADAKNGYVSLRATSVDTHGSTVTQTLIRAFKRG
jgi:subtilisin family serine protease